MGAHFGVVLVRDVFAQVEVATFRSDHEYEDGRRPTAVHFENDPRQDASRRDFTINGLMMDPDSGEVLDYVGGRADLEAPSFAPSAIRRRAFRRITCGCAGGALCRAPLLRN